MSQTYSTIEGFGFDPTTVFNKYQDYVKLTNYNEPDAKTKITKNLKQFYKYWSKVFNENDNKNSDKNIDKFIDFTETHATTEHTSLFFFTAGDNQDPNGPDYGLMLTKLNPVIESRTETQFTEPAAIDYLSNIMLRFEFNTLAPSLDKIIDIQRYLKWYQDQTDAFNNFYMIQYR